MILFLQNSDVRTLYTQTKEVKIPKDNKTNAGKRKNQVELTTVSVLYPANTKYFITFIQRRPNIFDVGPKLHKCYTNVLCLLGYGRMLGI